MLVFPSVDRSNDLWRVDAPARTAKGRAFPDPVGYELRRAGRNLRTRSAKVLQIEASVRLKFLSVGGLLQEANIVADYGCAWERVGIPCREQ
jgi:hypothetical protein